MSKYELIERLGTGSSAEMFRGRALASSGFEKPIAIKRLLPHLQRETRYVDWLLAEAKLVSKLRHRNIVQVFDVGLGEDGAYLMVLEYVDGANVATLQRYCEARGERISLDLALHIAAEVADALEYAHSAPGPDGKPLRVVHRDVSPPNILLSLAGEVKLTDFGFAARPDGQHFAGQRRVSYVSPELVAGEKLDARSDVFSLGVVLFELVTGQRLFSQLSEAAATTALLDGRIPRPRTIDSEIPMQLDVLMMRALARHPADRPPSAGQFAAMLREVRYQLESTAADPARELAGLVARLDHAKRQIRQGSSPARSEFPTSEASIIHVQPRAFHASQGGDAAEVLAARAALDKFEIEATNLAKAPAQLAVSRAPTANQRPSSQRTASHATQTKPTPTPGAAPARTPTPAASPTAPSTAPSAARKSLVSPRDTGFDDDEATRMVAAPAQPAVDDEATRMVATASGLDDESTRMALPGGDVNDESTRMAMPGSGVDDESTRMVPALAAPAPARAPSRATPPPSWKNPTADFGLDDQTVMGGEALVEDDPTQQPEPSPPAKQPVLATGVAPSPSTYPSSEPTMALDPALFESKEHTMAIEPSMFESNEHTMAIDPEMIEAEVVPPRGSAPRGERRPTGDSALHLAPRDVAAARQRTHDQVASETPFRVPTYAPAAFAQTEQAPSPLARRTDPSNLTPPADPLAAYVAHLPATQASPARPRATGSRAKTIPSHYWVIAALGVVILIAIILALR